MANKYISNNAGTLTEVAAIITSAGSGDSGKIVALDTTGKLASSFMPAGLGADTASIISSENIAAGNLVNIYSNASVFTARNADASAAGKEAMGFVLAAVTSPAAATVYFEGSNTSVTGLTPGRMFLSTTPGLVTPTAPSGSGQVVQIVGFATSATVLNAQMDPAITLAV